MEYLKEKGIGSGIHYIPANQFSVYKGYDTDLPNTKQLYSEILTLPLYCDMTDKDVETVIAVVKVFFGKEQNAKS